MSYYKKKRIGMNLSILCVVLWTAFIWGNSLLSGAESRYVSDQVIETVAPSMDFLNFSYFEWNFLVRKAAHMIEFGILGAFWTWMLVPRISLGWKCSAFGLGACFLTACADEGLQLLSDRTSQFRDVCIDTSGALLGILISMGVLLFIQHRQKTHSQEAYINEK